MDLLGFIKQSLFMDIGNVPNIAKEKLKIDKTPNILKSCVLIKLW